MNTTQIIDSSRALAREFIGKGHQSVRLAVFNFDDWCGIFKRPRQGESLQEFREQTRRNFYLFRFLRDKGVEVVPVPIAKKPFMEWVEQTGHDLGDGHGTSHAVGEYVNRPETPFAQCRHHQVATKPGQALATITVYGETPDQPEILGAVIHLKDGTVLASLEVLAADHSPDEAMDKIGAFWDVYQPQGVFQDPQVRQPEFCADCNGLMLSVASPADIDAQMQN